jgi:hypothetical protein
MKALTAPKNFNCGRAHFLFARAHKATLIA